MFAGVFRMHLKCPECDLPYFPEPGYYLGAIYFSYALSLLVGAPVAVGLLMAGVAYWPCIAATGGVFALLWLPIYQYSRVLWLHFDNALTG
ncbi:MAG: hypothetical protein FD180_3363 [Planctomycetota bacterium]|nr:MAG: hypothetical protein FD180_3363 [Planctomycetota bacterium]